MNKFSTPFKEIPCMIVAKNKLGYIITRNSSFLNCSNINKVMVNLDEC